MDSAYAALEAVQEMEVLIETIRSVRNIRAEMDVPVKKQIDLLIRAETESLPSSKTMWQRFAVCAESTDWKRIPGSAGRTGR